jgi:hypothetical protein
VGAMAYGSSLIVSSGVCQTPPITIALQPTNPSCSTFTNGSVSITATGGIAPYTYSLDGVNYQPSNVFLNLGSGAYTAYVKDSVNTVSNQSFTLTAQQIFQNYTVNLVLTPSQNLGQSLINSSNSSSRTTTWSVTVSPTPLPAGTVVNMSLLFNVLSTGYTSNISPTITNTITTATNVGATVSLISTSPTTTTSVIRPSCDGGDVITSAYTKTYSVQLSTVGFASGTIVHYINTPCSQQNNCELRGYLKDVVSIQNISITPNTCRSINPNVSPQQVTTQKIGVICLNG